jgi:hypothetical protein
MKFLYKHHVFCFALAFQPFITAEELPQSQRVDLVNDKVHVRFDGVPGRTYFLQSSKPGAEFKEWLWMPEIRSGNGTEISIEMNRTAGMRFFRLVYTNQPIPAGKTAETADFDSDNLSNIEEINPSIGFATHPTNADTDADGLKDGFERAHGIDPNDNGSLNPQNGANGSFQGSSTTTNLQAYQQGVQAMPNATLVDLDGDNILNELDADPRELLIDWPRSNAISSYAIIDLNMEPVGSFFPPRGRLPVYAVLNDHGAVCREALRTDEDFASETPAVWDGTSFPVQWSEVPDYLSAGGTPQHFDDGNVSFNNAGNIFDELELDDGSDNSPGARFVTIKWNDTAAVPTKFGTYDANTHRITQARFDHLAVETGNIDGATVSTTGFSISGNGDNEPRLQEFNTFSSYSPSVTRTGKILISQNGQLKVNDIPAPPNSGYGLTADPHANDLIVTSTLASAATLRHRNGVWETMPMPAIADMNADGVGITFPAQQVWANGSTIQLDDLLSESGWSEFKAEQINASGVILGSAKPLLSSVHKPVLMVPATLVVKQSESSETEDGARFTTLSDPKPDVEMVVNNSFVNAAGELEIHVNGTVRDKLSEVITTGRISQLIFKVNGSVTRTIQLAFNAGTAPWTLADSYNEFSEIIKIPNPQPGGYEVRAETNANAAGNTGWARAAVGLSREDDPTAEVSAFNDVTIALSSVTSDSAVDQITVYFGNRAPQQGDAVFTETAVNSGIFTGTLLLGTDPRECEIDLQPADVLAAADVDHLAAEIICLLPGDVRLSSYVSFEESAAASLRFRPDGFQVTAEKNFVRRLTDLPASQGSGFESIMMKLALPDAWAAANSFSVLVNGEAHSLKKFTYNGKEEWYVVGTSSDTRPKIFIPSHKSLPAEIALPGLLVPGETLDWKLVVNDTTFPLANTLILRGNSDSEFSAVAAAAPAAPQFSPAAPQAATAAGSWEEPGDTVNWTDLVTAYKFIYPDEISQAMLRVFLNQGHEISLEDETNDYAFSYNWRIGNKAQIKIENDDNDIHPGICAQYLWRGLNQALTIYSYRNALVQDLNDPVYDIEVIRAHKEQIGPAAAEVGIAAAELYLSGIGIINEPLDWILVVNDVSEGHYASLAAALPLIPRGMVTATKGIKIQTRSGQVLGALNQDAFGSLQDAARIRDMNSLGTVMDNFQLSAYIGKILAADGGWVRVPKNRDGLKQAMLRRVPKPSDDFVAHHDLIWAEAKWFAERGINVNNPAFGRWVHKTDHDKWHKGANGGDFNQFWKTFIAAEKNTENKRYTTAQIIDKLNDCRAEYSITITE